MKIQDTFIVNISDMHCGSSRAIFPNHFMQFEHTNYTPTDTQKKIHAHWLKCADYARQNRKSKRMIIVHNGDAIEGIHHGSIQAVSPSWDDHVEIHLELMDEFLKRAGFSKKNGDELNYLSGTESHTADKESGIAKDLKADHYEHEFEMKINGRRLWYTHHGAGAGDGANEGDGYRNWLKRIYWNCVKGKKPIPDMVVTGHFHKPVYNIYVQDYHLLHGMMLPSWQMKTRYAYKAAPFQRNDIGMSFYDVTVDGDIRVHKPLIMEIA